jgi:hypothetical protein
MNELLKQSWDDGYFCTCILCMYIESTVDSLVQGFTNARFEGIENRCTYF